MPASESMNLNPAGAAHARQWYDSTLVVTALLLFLWPIGVYALIRNRSLGGLGKVFIGGAITFLWAAFLGSVGYGGYLLYTHPEVARAYAPFLFPNAKHVEIADAQKKADDLAAVKTNPAPQPLATIDSLPVKQVASADNAGASASADVVDVKDVKSSVEISAKAPEPSKPDAAKIDDNRPGTDDGTKNNVRPVEATPKQPAADGDDDKIEAERKKKEDEGRAAAAAQKEADLNAKVTTLKERAAALINARKQQAADYEKALVDVTMAMALEPHIANMEQAFRASLKENYHTDTFDQAKFDGYFTEAYLANYNKQVQRQRGAMAAYIKILRDNDAHEQEDLAKLKTDVADANKTLAELGKPNLDLALDDAALDKRLNDLRAAANALPDRVITLADMRAKIGVKAVGAVTQPPVAANTNTPQALPPASKFPEVAPIQRAPTQGPASTGPVYPSAPAVPNTPAPPSITAGDILGIWARHDGKVSWGLEPGGIMFVRGGKTKSQGSWAFDEATATLSVTHGGVLQRFVVARENQQVFMMGEPAGPGGGPALRFNKVGRN